MNIAKIIAVIGILAMGFILIYGFTVGNIMKEGAIIGSMPWGIVSLVDVYTGFVLFCGWIFYREKSLVRAIIWTVAVMVFGNFVTSLYVLLTLLNSQGNWKQFWMGARV
jgi:hypothetical protein